MTQWLLDTNIVIWLSTDGPRIKEIKSLIFTDQSEIFVSSVSWWEIAIKIRTGKLPANFYNLQKLAKQHAIRELAITSKYLKVYQELPAYHKDPFDLMLLAQTITCPMRLITADAILAEYSSLVMVI